MRADRYTAQHRDGGIDIRNKDGQPLAWIEIEYLIDAFYMGIDAWNRQDEYRRALVKKDTWLGDVVNALFLRPLYRKPNPNPKKELPR